MPRAKVVGIGAVVGLALFSTGLGWLLDNHGDTVMAAMVGLMLGSLRVLWPWPNGVGVISEDETEVIDGAGLDARAYRLGLGLEPSLRWYKSTVYGLQHELCSVKGYRP